MDGTRRHTESGTYVRITFGYSAGSLLLVETLPPHIRQNIVAGKHIHLASLLLPCHGVSDMSDKRPDPRLNKQLSISKFIQAFSTYKNVMCDAFPNRRKELDLYERDIVEMATRYRGNGLY